MANFSGMSGKLQVALVAVGAVLITVGAYFLVFKSTADANRAVAAQVEAKRRDNELLRPYQRNLEQLIADTNALKEQLERYKLIVPDEKDADRYLTMLQQTAAASGIEIRKYVAKATTSKEYYVEVPFDLELDGRYDSVMNFFDHVSKLERIVNVSGVQMGSLKEGGGFGGGYQYAPHETIGAKCVATTFFSRDLTGAAANTAAAKPGDAKKK